MPFILPDWESVALFHTSARLSVGENGQIRIGASSRSAAVLAHVILHPLVPLALQKATSRLWQQGEAFAAPTQAGPPESHLRPIQRPLSTTLLPFLQSTNPTLATEEAFPLTAPPFEDLVAHRLRYADLPVERAATSDAFITPSYNRLAWDSNNRSRTVRAVTFEVTPKEAVGPAQTTIGTPGASSAGDLTVLVSLISGGAPGEANAADPDNNITAAAGRTSRATGGATPGTMAATANIPTSSAEVTEQAVVDLSNLEESADADGGGETTLAQSAVEAAAGDGDGEQAGQDPSDLDEAADQEGGGETSPAQSAVEATAGDGDGSAQLDAHSAILPQLSEEYMQQILALGDEEVDIVSAISSELLNRMTLLDPPTTWEENPPADPVGKLVAAGVLKPMAQPIALIGSAQPTGTLTPYAMVATDSLEEGIPSQYRSLIMELHSRFPQARYFPPSRRATPALLLLVGGLECLLAKATGPSLECLYEIIASSDVSTKASRSTALFRDLSILTMDDLESKLKSPQWIDPFNVASSRLATAMKSASPPVIELKNSDGDMREVANVFSVADVAVASPTEGIPINFLALGDGSCILLYPAHPFPGSSRSILLHTIRWQAGDTVAVKGSAGIVIFSNPKSYRVLSLNSGSISTTQGAAMQSRMTEREETIECLRRYVKENEGACGHLKSYLLQAREALRITLANEALLAAEVFLCRRVSKEDQEDQSD